MSNKQSSVEWLISELVDYQIAFYGTTFIPLRLIEQAKAMHKQESKVVFECGRNFQLTGENTFEQVYNETFNNQQ